MNYKIEFTGAARRQLRRISKQNQKRILDKIADLTTEPRPAGYIQLHTGDIRFRIRVGDYRIIYKIEDEVLLILILSIGDRKEIYR